jgi:hypothetical protein
LPVLTDECFDVALDGNIERHRRYETDEKPSRREDEQTRRR